MDGVMWSDKLKMVMWIELTSPWEENMTTWYFEKHDKYRKSVNAAEDNGWKVVPLCVEVGCRGYINDKWHHMVRALKLDKRMQKCSLRCSGEVQLLPIRMFASARVVHHKTAGLRFWRNNQRRVLQPAILIANRKKPRRSR